MIDTLAEQLRAMPALEALAVVLGIGYLYLAIQQNIWCWFCAGLSTAIYVWLLFDARLYMESALNVYYFGMAIYGFCMWRYGGKEQSSLPVTRWSLRVHSIAIAGLFALAWLSGSLLSRYTDAALPYIDSLTTWGALWATFLVARKVLENWWYWLVIDVVLVGMFWSRGLELTALLYVIYLAMIPFGLLAWRRSMREHPDARAVAA